ncbi:GNAT family N-acetyltransferase [bacterium]|nr:GNAT family N-acetyltransferase [bacterium]
MYSRYTGRQVRLRPIQSKEEGLAVHAGTRTEHNRHWGPNWWPQARLVKGWEEHGLLEGASGENSFIIERLDTGEVVGLEDCGLWGPGGISGWFGTSIFPQHRGQGFGREAKLLMLCFLFENFPVQRVGSDTVANHWAARRGMEACGMQLEGYRRAAHLQNGKWYDVPWYVIFREQWEQLEVRSYVKRG